MEKRVFVLILSILFSYIIVQASCISSNGNFSFCKNNRELKYEPNLFGNGRHEANPEGYKERSRYSDANWACALQSSFANGGWVLILFGTIVISFIIFITYNLVVGITRKD